MFKLDLEKAEESEIKLPTIAGSSKKQESSRKTSTSALLTMPKPLTVWITTNCGKFFKRREYQTTLPAFWEICMQLKKQVRWSWYSHLFKNFPQFVVIHTVKGFGVLNKAEVDVFLELSCFFDDPTDVGNLTSGSSAFSKSSLNTCKFTVHVLLKPGLENLEHYLASVWDE